MTAAISGGRAVGVTSGPTASLREAVVDIRRQLEDLAYVNVGDSLEDAGNEDKGPARKAVVQRARRMRRRNPLAKQAINLLQHYALGKGVSTRANNKAKVARIVDEFWDNPVNRKVLTGHRAQKKFLDDLYTDGEQFLVLFPDTEAGTLELSTLDTLLVEDVIRHPENRHIPLWYKVAEKRRRYNFRDGVWEDDPKANGTEFVYYRDWQNDLAEFQPPKRLQRDGLVMHVAINQHGARGESELLAAMDWVQAHKSFMEGRATLNEAAARIAWKKKRKGASASDIAAEVQRLQSSLTNTSSGYETNPPPARGATHVENENSTLEWVKTDTGGQAADYDERKLRMMAGSGLGGIPNHYFGDEANANLATATAMELPLLKTYEDWQTLFGNVLRDVIDYLLVTAHEAGRIGPRDDSSRYAERLTTPRATIAADNRLGDAGGGDTSSNANSAREAAAQSNEPLGAMAQITALPKSTPPAVAAVATDKSGAIDWYVAVEFPPIIEKQLDVWTAAVKALYELMPGTNIESQKLAVELMLEVMGQNDVDELMERIFPPDMPDPTAMPSQPDLQSALAGLLGARPAPKQLPGPTATAPDAAQREGLTALQEYRTRRLIRAVSDTRDAFAIVGD